MDYTEIELQQALDRIADLNKELGRDPSTDALYYRLTDPVQLAASRLIRVVKQSIRDAEHYPADAKRSLELSERLLSKAAEGEDREYELKNVARSTLEYEEKKAKSEAHLAALQQKLAGLQTEPHSMFLPLGTHVRVTGQGNYTTISDFHRMGVFAPGTEGVVARLNSDSEYGIAVAVVGPYVTDSGSEMNASDTRPHVVHFDRDQLEVVAYGLLPDGSPSKAYGFAPTYEMDDDELTEEMILSSNGLYWRFDKSNVERGRVELRCAYESLDDVPGTLRPLEEEAGLRM
jgi:hypothetical protein